MSKPPNPRVSSQQVVRKLFSLAEEEDVLDDFSCALLKKVLIHGRLFCTDNYICFYANIMGFKTKQVIPFREVTAIKRHKGSISNYIEVECTNKKCYYFGSFLRRNEAFSFIYNLWRNSGYCDEDQDTGYWSDNEDPPQMEEEKEGITMLPVDDTGDTYETLKVIIPISPQKFFELFIADGAVFSFEDHCRLRGDTEIETTPWAENEDLGGHSREIKFRTKINGPSIGPKTTRCHRAQVYKWEDSTLILKSSNKALDVPYSSYFVVEDEWNISEVGPDKSILKCTCTVNFLKATMFKGTIESRTKTDVTRDVEGWLRAARSKCLGEAQSSQEEEKQVHQLAKYEEVDLKAYRDKVQKTVPASKGLNSLMLLNFLCIVLLIFYLRHLHSRINDTLTLVENPKCN